MSKRHELWTVLLQYIVYFLILICVTFCLVTSQNEDTQIRFLSPTSFNNGWVLHMVEDTPQSNHVDKDISLPYSIKGVEGISFTITNTLPADLSDHSAIAIGSNYCFNEIFIDGQVRYTYGDKAVLPFGRMVGNIKCIVPLESADAGKAIEICITPHYTQGYEIPRVYMGGLNDIKAHVVYDNLWKIILCTVLSAFMLIAFSFGFYQIIRKVNTWRNICLYFSMFVCCAVFWIICSSDLPQLLTSANEAVSFLSYLSLAFIGAPFMAFCSYIFPTGQKWLSFVGVLGSVNTLVVILLFMTGIVDPPQILITSHIYFGIVLLSDLYYSLKERKNNNYIHRFMLFANIFLLIFVGLGLGAFYINPTSGYDSVFFSIGFTMFIAILFAMLIFMQLHVTQEAIKLAVYKELAYTDTMTQLGNRASFDLEFSRLSGGTYIDYGSATLIILDVNGLKVVNDTLGHFAGDTLIKGAASSIQDTFENIGKLFRIGGDEFAVILLGEHDMDALLAKLDVRLALHSQKSKIEISIAKGMVTFPLADLNKDKMRTYFQQADDLMYQNKAEMKSQNK